MEQPDRKIVEEFFSGKCHWSQLDTDGHYWIARHGGKWVSKVVYDTESSSAFNKAFGIKLPEVHSVKPTEYFIDEFEVLTFEPLESKGGGQFEVAIRIWCDGQWKGYFVMEDYLHGVNTQGH